MTKALLGSRCTFRTRENKYFKVHQQAFTRIQLNKKMTFCVKHKSDQEKKCS